MASRLNWNTLPRISRAVFILSMWLLSPSSQSFQLPRVEEKKFGTFNFDEIENYHYSIGISVEPIVAPVEDQQESLEENAEGTLDGKGGSPEGTGKNVQSVDMILTSIRGQKYSCSVPNFDSPSALGKAAEVFPNVSKVLKPLQDGPCLSKTMGWWTYEYCHGKFIRQYHVEAGRIVGETLYMGFYANETIWDEEEVGRVKLVINSMKNNLAFNSHSVAYHSLLYTNGTECDLTKKPRKTLVKIMCGLSGESRLFDVQETDTCTYNLYVRTPLLCNLPLFNKAQSGKEKVIKCSPLVSQKGYQNFLRKKEKERKFEIEGSCRKEDKDFISEEKDEVFGGGTKTLKLPEPSFSSGDDIVENDKSSQSEEDDNKDSQDTTLDTTHEVMGKLLKLVSNVKKRNEFKERRFLLDKIIHKIQPELNEAERKKQVDSLQDKFEYLSLDELQNLVDEIEGVQEKGSGEVVEMEETLSNEEQELLDQLEMDDESLAHLEEEVTAELKERLSELGLPADGTNVKLKVITMSKKEWDEMREETGDTYELDSSEDTELSSLSDSTKEKKSDRKVAVKMSLVSNFQDSMSDRSDEREKVTNLEAGYNSVWDDDNQRKNREKRV